MKLFSQSASKKLTTMIMSIMCTQYIELMFSVICRYHFHKMTHVGCYIFFVLSFVVLSCKGKTVHISGIFHSVCILIFFVWRVIYKFYLVVHLPNNCLSKEKGNPTLDCVLKWHLLSKFTKVTLPLSLYRLFVGWEGAHTLTLDSGKYWSRTTEQLPLVC